MINGTEKILVCCGTGCIANGALGVADAIEAELAARGLADDVQVDRRAHGLLGRMRARPHRALHAARPHVLPREGARRGRHRRLARRRAGAEAAVQEGRPNLRAHGRQPVLRPAAQGRVEGRRHHRPAVDRRLHRARRLRGPEEGAHHDARRDHHRSREERPARQGRRGLPHRAQVAHGGRLRRLPEIHRLQRRRGRPRRVHGRLHDGGQPACRHRGHDHRRAGHRRRRGRALHPRRVRARTRPHPARHRRRVRGRHPGRVHHGNRPQARPFHRPRRRRVRLRRVDGAHGVHRRAAWANRAPSTSAACSAACSTIPRC